MTVNRDLVARAEIGDASERVVLDMDSPGSPVRGDLPPVIGPPSMLVHTPLQPGGAERNPAVTAGSLPGLAAGRVRVKTRHLFYWQ